MKSLELAASAARAVASKVTAMHLSPQKATRTPPRTHSPPSPAPTATSPSRPILASDVFPASPLKSPQKIKISSGIQSEDETQTSQGDATAAQRIFADQPQQPQRSQGAAAIDTFPAVPVSQPEEPHTAPAAIHRPNATAAVTIVQTVAESIDTFPPVGTTHDVGPAKKIDRLVSSAYDHERDSGSDDGLPPVPHKIFYGGRREETTEVKSRSSSSDSSSPPIAPWRRSFTLSKQNEQDIERISRIMSS